MTWNHRHHKPRPFFPPPQPPAKKPTTRMQATLDHFFPKTLDHNKNGTHAHHVAKEPRLFARKRAREAPEARTVATPDGPCTPPTPHMDPRQKNNTHDVDRKLGTFGCGVSSYHIANDFMRRLSSLDTGRYPLNFTAAWLGATQPLSQPDVGLFPRCVHDFATDSRGEFAIVRQKPTLTLLSTHAGSASGANDDMEDDDIIISISAHLIQRRESGETSPSPSGSLSFGFSTAEFVGSTLSILCGVSRGHSAEVFDLEAVDETTCVPSKMFDLRRVQRFGQSSSALDYRDARRAPCVSDASSLSDQLVLGSLSSGESVWFDTRQRHPILCTPMPNSCFGGSAAHTIASRTLRTGVSPLTSVCFSANGHRIVTGAKDGCIRLWDSRNTQYPIDSFQNRTEICAVRAHSSARHPGTTSIWANDYAGDVFELLCGSDGFSEATRAVTQDAKRTGDTASLPPGRISLLMDVDMLFYPHLSSNSLMGFSLLINRHESTQACDSFDLMDFDHDSPSEASHDRQRSSKATGFSDFKLASTLHRASPKSTACATHAAWPLPYETVNLVPTVVIPVQENQGDHISCCCAIDVHDTVLVGSAQGRTTRFVPVAGDTQEDEE